MPPLETTDRKQKAVYWAYSSDDQYGKPVVSATPVELDVRWEEATGEVLTPNGDRLGTDAKVIVDQDVALGSIMWLGKLSAHTAGTSTDYRKVISFSKIPSLKKRQYRRVVLLQKFRDTLPTTE